jgi:cation transport regulator ChaC
MGAVYRRKGRASLQGPHKTVWSSREEESEMAKSKAKSGQNRDELHDMRQQAHQMGIEGNSKMSTQQLNNAMKMTNKGADPMMAKQQAKSKTK